MSEGRSEAPTGAKIIRFPRIARLSLYEVIKLGSVAVLNTMYREQPEVVDLLMELAEKGGKSPDECSATISGAALIYLGLKMQMEKGE